MRLKDDVWPNHLQLTASCVTSRALLRTHEPRRQHPALELDIERHVNHTRFGPKSFEDCRKMGNNVIFQSVGYHNPSRMAPPGAVLEAYMTPTAPLRDNFSVFATNPARGLSLSR
jgi:hypothetical protein